MLFSRTFCLSVVYFTDSHWSRTQNVNKLTGWLTLFSHHEMRRLLLRGIEKITKEMIKVW